MKPFYGSINKMDLTSILKIVGVVFKALASSHGLLEILSFLAIVICIFVIRYMSILLYNGKVYYIKTQKSMNKVEASVESLSKILERHYLMLAKTYFGEDFFTHIEKFLYTKILREPFKAIHRHYLERIRKNGFEHMSYEEWQRYKEACIEEDITTFTSELNEEYYPLAKIQRDIVYDHNLEILRECEDKANELLEELLRIAKKYKYKKFFKKELLFH